MDSRCALGLIINSRCALKLVGSDLPGKFHRNGQISMVYNFILAGLNFIRSHFQDPFFPLNILWRENFMKGDTSFFKNI